MVYTTLNQGMEQQTRFHGTWLPPGDNSIEWPKSLQQLPASESELSIVGECSSQPSINSSGPHSEPIRRPEDDGSSNHSDDVLPEPSCDSTQNEKSTNEPLLAFNSFAETSMKGSGTSRFNGTTAKTHLVDLNSNVSTINPLRPFHHEVNGQRESPTPVLASNGNHSSTIGHATRMQTKYASDVPSTGNNFGGLNSYSNGMRSYASSPCVSSVSGNVITRDFFSFQKDNLGDEPNLPHNVQETHLIGGELSHSLDSGPESSDTRGGVNLRKRVELSKCSYSMPDLLSGSSQTSRDSAFSPQHPGMSDCTASLLLASDYTPSTQCASGSYHNPRHTLKNAFQDTTSSLSTSRIGAIAEGVPQQSSFADVNHVRQNAYSSTHEEPRVAQDNKRMYTLPRPTSPRSSKLPSYRHQTIGQPPWESVSSPSFSFQFQRNGYNHGLNGNSSVDFNEQFTASTFNDVDGLQNGFETFQHSQFNPDPNYLGQFVNAGIPAPNMEDQDSILLNVQNSQRPEMISLYEASFKTSNSRSLFISNIPPHLSAADMEAVLAIAGDIDQLYVGRVQDGFAVVTYFDLRHARIAYRKCNLEQNIRACFCVDPLDVHATTMDTEYIDVIEMHSRPLSLRFVASVMSEYGAVGAIANTDKEYCKRVAYFDRRCHTAALEALRYGKVYEQYEFQAFASGMSPGTMRQCQSLFKILVPHGTGNNFLKHSADPVNLEPHRSVLQGTVHSQQPNKMDFSHDGWVQRDQTIAYSSELHTMRGENLLRSRSYPQDHHMQGSGQRRHTGPHTDRVGNTRELLRTNGARDRIDRDGQQSLNWNTNGHRSQVGKQSHRAQPGNQSTRNSSNSGANRNGNSSTRKSDTNGRTQRDHRGSGSVNSTPNPAKILAGEDKRTSLMIRNIPNKYTQKMFLDEINENFANTYDFFYLPIDFKNKCNVGYAFINFIEPETVASFVKIHVNKEWKRFNSVKICQVSYARLQGKSEFVARFQNSTVMEREDEYLPLVFCSHGENRGQPEAFPKPFRTPKQTGLDSSKKNQSY